jgi:hypothetical protein
MHLTVSKCKIDCRFSLFQKLINFQKAQDFVEFTVACYPMSVDRDIKERCKAVFPAYGSLTPVVKSRRSCMFKTKVEPVMFYACETSHFKA